MTILLVEPDDDLVALLTFLLRRDGHDVLTARDAPSAQRRLSTKPAALVIAAIELGQGSGWSLCEQLASAGDTPVLLLGEPARPEDHARALELGAAAYLTK